MHAAAPPLKLNPCLRIFPWLAAICVVHTNFANNNWTISIDLWRRYINNTITILDIVQRPLFYLKHSVSETGFSPRFLAERTQVYRKERVSACLRNGIQNVESLMKGRTMDNVQNYVINWTIAFWDNNFSGLRSRFPFSYKLYFTGVYACTAVS
jgi:hypothetical protein